MRCKPRPFVAGGTPGLVEGFREGYLSVKCVGWRHRQQTPERL